jgi:hypothetical protein
MNVGVKSIGNRPTVSSTISNLECIQWQTELTRVILAPFLIVTGLQVSFVTLTPGGVQGNWVELAGFRRTRCPETALTMLSIP